MLHTQLPQSIGEQLDVLSPIVIGIDHNLFGLAACKCIEIGPVIRMLKCD
jgi:hypothetical protein